MVLQSDSYGGRYYELVVEQGTGTAINWSLTSIGGTSNKYASSPISVVINNATVFSLAAKAASSTNNDPPVTKGLIGSGSYDPGLYGTFNVSFSGRPYYGTATTKTGTVTTQSAYTKYTVNSWSAQLVKTILYLKSIVSANVTKGTGNIEFVENEIGESNDNIVKQNTKTGIVGNYSGTDILTVTGYEIQNTTGLGVPLYSNFEVSDNLIAEEYYSEERYAAPTNLMEWPEMPGKPVLEKMYPDHFTLIMPTVTDWKRNEPESYYFYGLAYCNSEGEILGYVWGQYQMSPINTNYIWLNIEKDEYAGRVLIEPTTETVEPGYFNAYTILRGYAYYFRTVAITKYLGVLKTRLSELSGPVYIPFIPNMSANSFGFTWMKKNGKIYRVLTSGNINLTNEHSVVLGNMYLGINDNKALITNISGNIWSADINNINNQVEYKNVAMTLKAKALLNYASDYYSEGELDPLESSINYQVDGNLINVQLENPTLDGTNLKFNLVTFNLPDKNLGTGTMNATLIISKDPNFENIIYQQVKVVTSLNEALNLYDDMELNAKNVGINYIKVIWNLSNSSDYYGIQDISSNVVQVNFEAVRPVIDTFTSQFDANFNVNVVVEESTGSPQPTLTIEVSRTPNGPVYESYIVDSGEVLTLPLNEPGTVWFIRAKADNGTDTVYALDENGEVKEYIMAVPYEVTPNYETYGSLNLSTDGLQLDGRASLSFNWTPIETNLYKTKYTITMRSTNQPVLPLIHEDVEPGYNYVFEGRIPDEIIGYNLKCELMNSFGEILESYEKIGPDVTLVRADYGDIVFTYYTTSTYHSIKYNLENLFKNNNKLLRMDVELKTGPDGEIIERYYIGDPDPNMFSPDILPLTEYTFDNLQPDTSYEIGVRIYQINPANPEQIYTKAFLKDVRTSKFNVYPVKNPKATVTNLANNKPTVDSEIELTWIEPDEGDAELTNYIVRYKKQNSDFTNFNVNDTNYKLTKDVLQLENGDIINIEIGARYLDYKGDEVIIWKELPAIKISQSNFVFYFSYKGDIERDRRVIYRQAETESSEKIVKNIYLDE